MNHPFLLPIAILYLSSTAMGAELYIPDSVQKDTISARINRRAPLSLMIEFADALDNKDNISSDPLWNIHPKNAFFMGIELSVPVLKNLALNAKKFTSWSNGEYDGTEGDLFDDWARFDPTNQYGIVSALYPYSWLFEFIEYEGVDLDSWLFGVSYHQNLSNKYKTFAVFGVKYGPAILTFNQMDVSVTPNPFYSLAMSEEARRENQLLLMRTHESRANTQLVEVSLGLEAKAGKHFLLGVNLNIGAANKTTFQLESDLFKGLDFVYTRNDTYVMKYKYTSLEIKFGVFF